MTKMDQNFFEKVYAVVVQVPKGKVTSYGAIAEYLGSRISSRMVGWAMHACPLNVPAHRVLNRNGMLTGKQHFSTPTLMQEMLESEGIIVENDKVKDLKKIYWDPNMELTVGRKQLAADKKKKTGNHRPDDRKKTTAVSKQSVKKKKDEGRKKIVNNKKNRKS